MGDISINIGGDVFLGRRIESIAVNNPSSLFDAKILEIFAKANFNILNLESPLTDARKDQKLVKTGPNLKASPKTVGALGLLNINLLTLANNHIYDYDQIGLSDTFEICKRHNIATVGAGHTLEEASQIFFKKINEITLAIVNIAENEWCNANQNRGGANPLNIINNIRSINKARELADIVILIIHGGHELYYYPSPRMVELYRFYAEQGASVVVGHHSHCISGNEIYRGVPIFYGLGNFLFDNETDFEGWYEGILLNIQVNSQKAITCKFHPYKQCRNNFKIEPLEGSERNILEKKIKDINLIIADPDKLQKKFNVFIRSQKAYLLSIFSTSYFFNNRYIRSSIRKLGLQSLFLRSSQLKLILNYFRCEAHQDISTKVLFDYINRPNDDLETNSGSDVREHIS